MTDVLLVGQGDVRIRAATQNVNRAAAASNALVTSIESDTELEVSFDSKQTEEYPIDTTKQNDQPEPPPPKKRGRPPKAKKDVSVATPLTASQPPAFNSLAASSRSTRRRSQLGIQSSPMTPQDLPSSTNTPSTSVSRTTRRRKQVTSSSLPLHESASLEKATTAEPRKIRRQSEALVTQQPTSPENDTAAVDSSVTQHQVDYTNAPSIPASHGSRQPSQDAVDHEYQPAQSATTFADPDTIVVDSGVGVPKESTPVSQRQEATESLAFVADDNFMSNLPPSPEASTGPPMSSLHNVIGSNEYTSGGSIEAPVSMSPPPFFPPQVATSPMEPTPEPLDEDDPVEPTEPIQRRSSSRFSAAELLPEATFTSQADMDWEDGKDGVYVNPPGVKVKKPQHFKKKKHSTLVVFRSPKLKDPNRLMNGKDTWQERIMPVVTQARLTSADDAVEQGLVPKLNKKRKADLEVEPTPRKKVVKKRAPAEGEIDPSLAQEWGEGYPNDDSESEYSGISILEADVPPVPENPSSWSTVWTRDGAEEARLNTNHRNFNHNDRASSFTPSDSQTPYGSPSPVDFDDSTTSRMAASNLNSQSAGPQPPPMDPLLSITSSAPAPSPIQDSHPPFTPSKKGVLNLPAFTPPPARTYRSPYAPVESAGPVGFSANVESRTSDGYAQPQISPFASFGKSTTPITVVQSSLATEQRESSAASVEKFPALKVLQSSNKVPSYRSPYAPPTQNSEILSESPAAGTLPNSHQHVLNGSALTQATAETPASTQTAGSQSSATVKDIVRPTEPFTVATEARPGIASAGDSSTPGDVADFLSFMERDLSTPSGSKEGKGVRGRSSTHGNSRGRGQGGTRAGRGRARGKDKTLIPPAADQTAVSSSGIVGSTAYIPLGTGGTPEFTSVPALAGEQLLVPDTPTQGASQTTSDNVSSVLESLRTAALNGPYPMVPLDFVPQTAFHQAPPQSQSLDNAPMSDYGTPSFVQPGIIPTTEVEHADSWMANRIEQNIPETPAQSATRDADGEVNMMETPQTTPSQSKAPGIRSAKSKANTIPNSKRTPALKTTKVRSDPDERLRIKVAEAQDVEVADGATKFPCIYKDAVGNLVLSSDQKFLDFVALTQTPPELPIASMKVFHINGNPIMSAKGSFPMELHIKTKDEKNRKRAYRFTYASAETDAAQEMRTKIVTAMIASEFTAGDFASVAEAQAAKVRPFLCELCGDRFKNPNGLEYHLNKAKTKCNPNWDPEADTGKRVYRRKSKGDKVVSSEGAPRTPRKKKPKARNVQDEDDLGSTTSEEEPVLIPRSARRVTSERVLDSDGEEAPRSTRPARKSKQVEDDDLDADGDSDDSIFNWARNNATSGYAKSRRSASVSETPRPPRSANKSTSKRKQTGNLDADEDSDASLVEWFEKHGKIDSNAPASTKTPRIYKALNREAEVADQIVKEFADRIRDGEEEIFGLAITPTSQLTTAYEIATSMTCKELNSKWYEEVVTQLVQRNEGMFPAENSVWFASVAIWLKQHPLTTVLPESKFCNMAVDDLVASKTFTRVVFEFKDRNRNPRSITRSILTANGLDMSTQRADLIKELVQESHPKAYVPSQLAPPPSALDKLQAVVARLLPSLTVLADSQEEDRDESPIPDFGDDSDSDDFMEDAQADVESQESEDDMDLDEEEDPVSALSETKKSKKRDRTSTGIGPKRRRDAGHNAKISEGVRRRFAEIRAGGENPYPWHIKTKTKYVSAAERLKINEDKKRRDQETAAAKRACWGTALAYMPNTETGAWDQIPIPHGNWMMDDKTSKSRYARRQRLPEPITFLQALDGSWSVRPFGHGVNPIYSRPSRRAEGNPTHHLYLNRIENSHRPIVYPPVKNRVNLPAVPSRRLLEAVESGRPIDEKTGLPVVSRYAATRKRRASSAMSPETDEQPAPKRKRRAASVRFAGLDSDEDSPSGIISRATGKPLRRYSRNFPKQVFVPNVGDPRLSGSRSFPARKSSRKPKFTEVEILNFYEPKKLAAGGPRNPGLDTIPAQYGLDAPNGPSDWNYSPVYSGIIFIAAGFVSEDQEPGNSSWTVKQLDTYRPADYSLRWDDATAFTAEDLPYSDLQEESSWNPGLGISGYNGADFNAENAVDLMSDDEVEEYEEPKRKRQRKDPKEAKQGKQAKDDRGEKYSYVRQHTALAMDFVDLFEDPVVAGKYFGVEIGTPNESTLKRSRNLGSNIMLPDMESRFAVSVMVIRILTGGLDLQVDWILVSQMFPEYSLNFLKKVWNGILLRKKPAILRLEDQFREKFLVAYQENEIPRINYERLTEYPWAELVEWVIRTTDCSMNNKTIFLPSTREEVVEDYDLREAKEDGCPWRENYFSITTAVYKRIMASAAVSHAIPFQPRKRHRSLDNEIDDFAVCRSWVRVAAITPNEDWNRDFAKSKLASFNRSLLSDVLDSLTSQKIVKKRAANKAKNGRVYEIHDTWSTSLRRHMKESQFIEAVTFKRWMDAQFASGVQSVKADYFANEGTIMCLTSLQAHGRIRFLGADIPMNRFGLGDGGYETKKIPKERLRFTIDIYPTSEYIFDDSNPVLSNILFRDPPRGGEQGEIPIWYGLTGKPIWRVWYKILAAVGQVVALRAGVNITGLKESFRVTLEDWEWRLLLEWGVEVGMFVRLGEEGMGGGGEGWSVGEWWWAVVGSGWLDGEGMGMAVDQGGVGAVL